MSFYFKLNVLASVIAITSCSNQGFITTKNFNESHLPSLDTKQSPVNKSPLLTLSSIHLRVIKNNPHLRAARIKLDEIRGRIIQSGRPANPTIGLGIKKNIPNSEGSMDISFSQRFPVTNKLFLEKRVTKQELLIAKEEIKIAEEALTSAAQLLAVEAITLRDQRNHINKQISALDTLATFIEDAAKRGELSPLDAPQTRLEIQSLKTQQEKLRGEEQLRISQLKNYIGLSTVNQLRIADSLPSSSLPSNGLILSNRPEYRAKVMEIEHAKSSILLEKSRRYDDIEASVSAGVGREEDAPEGLETEGSVGFGITIPLPLYNKNEGNIISATAKAKRHTLEKAAIAADIRQQVAREKQTMKAWINQNQLITSKLLPLAKKNSKDLEQAYRNGQSDFTSLLKSKTEVLKLQSQLLENAQQFHLARVRYFAALGQPNSTF